MVIPLVHFEALHLELGLTAATTREVHKPYCK